MPPAKNLTGQVYGRLTVIERASDVIVGRPRWLCRCSCGNETIVSSLNLYSGNTKSCGCFRTEASKTRERKKGHPTLGVVLSYYKRNATLRGLKWNLTVEQFDELVTSNCHYCGAEPTARHLHNATRTYNGIDRVDNSLDYTPQNVVPCCTQCNRAKGTLTAQEFIEWALSIRKEWNDGPILD